MTRVSWCGWRIRAAAFGCLITLGCYAGAENVAPGELGPLPRFEAAVAYDSARDRTVLFGGTRDDGPQGSTWTLTAGRWSLLTNEGPGPRRGAAMVYDAARDRMVLFGGLPSDPRRGCAETWVLVGDAWERVDVEGPSCRYRHTMTYDATAERVVLFGGRSSGGCEDGDCQQTWAYDGAWVQLDGP